MASAETIDIGTLITRTPGVYGGRPCLAGTRYPVIEIAVHYNAGEPAEQIAADYHLLLPHVYAGIAYYLANKRTIDAELEEERIAYEAALTEHLAERARASA
jgi:uncharacterized protein (DUF433 family)